MRSYLAVPTYLMELFTEIFTLSWAVEKVEPFTVSPT
jgi:hypothetical protein